MVSNLKDPKDFQEFEILKIGYDQRKLLPTVSNYCQHTQVQKE